MTSQVGEYINTYGYTAFRKLSGRAQCALMYNAFKAKTSNEKASLRVQKTKFYAAMEEQIVNIVNKTLPPKPLPQTKTPITPPNDALPHSQGGGLQKLTEEIFEDALVRVLYEDPTKALAPALAFLDKKKSLSVEDTDTNISQIALDKLEQKRKAMFT